MQNTAATDTPVKPSGALQIEGNGSPTIHRHSKANLAGVGLAALGERRTVCWEDGAPDLNRRMVRTTPYAI